MPSMSEDRNTCSYEYRVGSEFCDWVKVAMTACTHPCSGVAIASTLRPSEECGPEKDDNVKSFSQLTNWNSELNNDHDYEFRARKIKPMEASSVPHAQQWYDGGDTSSGKNHHEA